MAGLSRSRHSPANILSFESSFRARPHSLLYRGHAMNLLILVVDDEPDVEMLFRQQFRRDLRDGRFTMDFAQSAPAALPRLTTAADAKIILILSNINMPGMSGLELLPKAKAAQPTCRSS